MTNPLDTTLNTIRAAAEAEWRQGETGAAQLARFCDALEADFARRQQGD